MSLVGVCEWCLPVNGPFAVDFAAKAGFDGIQLGDLGGSKTGFPMTNECIREGYLEAAARTGIVLHSIDLHSLMQEGGNIYPMNSPEGEAANESIRNGIDSCQAMGISCLNIAAFFQSFVKNDYDLENLIAHLRYACEYGKDRGVYVAYEPGAPVEKIKRILNEVPDLMLNYDLLNPFSMGFGEPAEELREYGSAIISHVHVKDRAYDSFGRRKGGRFAGEGSGNIPALIHLLKTLGYDKWYFSESEYLNPKTYGVGNDQMLICQKDCQAIRNLLKEA